MAVLNLETELTELELKAWTAFVSVMQNFLGNKKSDNYIELVENLLLQLKNMGCNMSIRLHFLHSHLDRFSENLGDMSEKQGERLHLDLRVMEECYQGFWDTNMISYYCWSLIEVLGTAADVTGQGVGTFLLKTALDSAYEMRHPLVQVIAVSKYASRICEKCGMKQVWKMQYRDFVDKCGQSVFYPRSPHDTVAIYVKYVEPHKGGEFECKPNL